MKPLRHLDNFYDFLKHIATLSTGSIVLLATFAEKFSQDAAWRQCLGMSMTFFLISVLSSIVCAFLSFIQQAGENERKREADDMRVVIFFAVTLGAFFTGVLNLGIFAIKNF
jgi:hypothetical protein